MAETLKNIKATVNGVEYEFDNPQIAAEYSASSTYAVGDYCTYQGQTYKCTTAITAAQAWTPANWSAVYVADEIETANQDLSEVETTLANKAERAIPSQVGDFALLTETGGLEDAGVSPSTYLDETLSISGKAADAKTVGDEVYDLKSALNYLTDVDYTWTIGKTISSSGTEGTSIVGAVSDPVPVEGGNLITRPAPVTDDNGVAIIIHVCQYVNGVFQSRTSITTDGLMLASATTSVRFNIARAQSTGIVMTQEDVDKYFTVNLYRKFDLLADVKNKLQGLRITSTSAQNTYGALLTNIPANIFSWVSNTWFTDSPASGYFYIIHLRTINYSSFTPETAQGTQIAIYPDTGAIFTRRIKSGSWTNWVSNQGVFPVYYAFGDSLTWGAVWDSNQSTALYQADLSDQMPTRIANAIGSVSFANYGASGARFVAQSGDSSSKKTIVDLIKETNFTGVDIVTIGGGRNDSETSLGNGDTATANDGTICGAVVDALSYLTTNYPKLQIVMYGVTPQPTSTEHAPSDIYTRVFSGGWSLNTYYEEVKKVCNRYGVPFIDWYDCTLMLRWGELSGGYSDGTQNWSHPLSSDIYRQMGNYLAGKVSSCYSG